MAQKQNTDYSKLLSIDDVQRNKEDILKNNIPRAEATRKSVVSATIVESWIRCKDLGLDIANTPKNSSRTSKHSMPVETKSLSSISKAFFRIADRNSSQNTTFLLLTSTGIVYKASCNVIPEAQIIIDLGILNEQTCATFANTIVQQKERTSVVVLTEHFFNCFAEIISISTPVINSSNVILGYLVALHKPKEIDYIVDNHGKKYFDTTRIAALKSAVIFAACDIGNQYNMQQLDSWTKVLESFFTGSLSLIREGCIITDSNGLIVELNLEAKKILNVPADGKPSQPIFDFFASDIHFQSIIKNGQTVNNFKAYVTVDNKIIECMTCVRPVRSANALHNQGCIITIAPIGANPSSLPGFIRNPHTFDTIVGDSEELEKAKRLARIFAPTNAHIMLYGETGTGKEMLAHAIHNSRDASQPFISINCAATSLTSFEAEVFGYEGKHRSLPGKIEMANGGTLFLYEVGDLPLDIQPYFVHIIDSRYVTPINGSDRRPVSFKLIASTKHDLKSMVDNGTFREDLYYRITSSIIRLPPLRERKNDISKLCETFIREFCETNNLPPVTIDRQVFNLLENYDWPGNVRQLRSCIRYAIDVCQNKIITQSDLPIDILSALNLQTYNTKADEFVNLKDLEKQRIEQALRRTNNNVPEAAKLLGMGRSTLYGRIKQFHLNGM